MISKNKKNRNNLLNSWMALAVLTYYLENLQYFIQLIIIIKIVIVIVIIIIISTVVIIIIITS